MLKSYFQVAWRGLKRDKGYAFINVAGLSVGLAACLVIALFIQHKLSYDRFFEGAEHVFRLIRADLDEGIDNTSMPVGLAPALKEHFPEIEHFVLVQAPGEALFSVENTRLLVERVALASDAFFDVFPHAFLRGNPETALTLPNHIVLTESLAQRLFGREDPVGKIVTYENRTDLRVSGVIKDIPSNTHFRFDAIRSFSKRNRDWWIDVALKWRASARLFTYLRLQNGISAESLEAKVTAFEEANKPDGAFLKDEPPITLQALTRIHLYSKSAPDIAPQSDIRYLFLFGIVGLLILLIACINYINLATARAVRRAREVGIRKVVGASRAQLVRQFLSEALLVSLCASAVALLLVRLVLPLLSELVGQEITSDSAPLWQAVVVLFVVVTLVGMLSGWYPALYLSRFRPTAVLTGRGTGLRAGSATLRKALIVFQFAASLALIISMLTIQKQLDYVKNKRLGFDKEYVVLVHNISGVSSQQDAFKQEILSSPHIMAVSMSPPPDQVVVAQRSIQMQESEELVTLNQAFVDQSYAETLGLRLVAGRFFSGAHSGDSTIAVVLNKTAVRSFNLGETPTGRSFTFGQETYTVVGVVEDFHTASLHEPIIPLVFSLDPPHPSTLLVRIREGSTAAALEHLRTIYERFIPDRPFVFTFMDDRLQTFYQAEQRLARIFGVFTGLAALIACLGLSGLAAFTTARRTKEVGVRKAFGASAIRIVVLLSKDFLLLVLLGLTLAVLPSYLAMARWLEDFAYRVEVGPGLYGVAGVLAMLIVLCAVCYQAIRAARANPVDALRHE